jgi:hypothetical protein
VGAEAGRRAPLIRPGLMAFAPLLLSSRGARRQVEGDSLAWGEAHLPRPLPLLGKLRGGTAALLGVGESEVRSWIEESARWAEWPRREMAG